MNKNINKHISLLFTLSYSLEDLGGIKRKTILKTHDEFIELDLKYESMNFNDLFKRMNRYYE